MTNKSPRHNFTAAPGLALRFEYVPEFLDELDV